MKFLVPQFIEVEDKILGPLTIKQAIYLLGGAGIVLILFLQFGFIVAVLFGAPFLVLSMLLAFVKVHGRPFIYVLSSAFFFFTKNKLYLWKKTPKKKSVVKKQEPETPTGIQARPTQVEMSQSKLKQLAWSLDTNNPFDSKKK